MLESLRECTAALPTKEMDNAAALEACWGSRPVHELHECGMIRQSRGSFGLEVFGGQRKFPGGQTPRRLL